MENPLASDAVLDKENAAPFVPRPRHLALCAFVMTLLAYTPTMTSFEEAPHLAALADTFLFAFLLATVLAAATLTLAALQGERGMGERRGITVGAVSAYAVGTLGFVLLLFAPTAMPVLAVVAGLLAGAALPWIVVAWARRVAAPMDHALVLCAFVVVATSFGGWLLTLLPLHLLAPLFCLLVMVSVAPLILVEPLAFEAAETARPGNRLGRLASVTWLPLLGLAIYGFMTDVMTHSAFGVVRASFVGGLVAAAVVFGACLRWAKRPLVPWFYRVLVPLLGAVFIVLGSFPANTFPHDASTVALYGFYIVLALLGCALFLAVVHGGELAADLACGFAVAVVSTAALVGQILSTVLMVTHDFGPWLTVLTGLFIAVLLVFLGRTAWDALVTPTEEAPGASSTTETPVPEMSMRDTLESRCAEVAATAALSPREAEVLVYLARGFNPAYIAKELVLSISTVRTHVRNIYRKLNINKREELLHLIDGD